MKQEREQKELFFQLHESLLHEIKKLDTKTHKKPEKKQEKDEKHIPAHNSLQHDPAVSAPLLSLLVEALKKDAHADVKDGLEVIAEEAGEKKIDPVVALAERIKQMYANEMMQQAYMNAQSSYNPLSAYTNVSSVILPTSAALNSQEGYEEAKKLEPKAVSDENSVGYKISRGDKYQAFIMTDPKGRLHSTWEIVRVINETADGLIERNDGYHSQMIL